ncbi:LOB domain-containing protein 24 [Carex littledalei]|uniref:LOB domain-containing protein 24 n=1 Tax=Carex littledalei TaxID=544730 RepID=A0A833RDR1_9POAL|nr:LOB domain-containing protein 24 [Carex littledalei]
MFTSSNSVEGSSSKRCAGCKHLRRRCTEDCILAPYFPANNPERFECIHKIFGAGNVARMLKMLPVDKRAQAANSLSTEAYWRVKEPVYGSTGVVIRIQQEISVIQCELAKTLAQISMYEAHNAPEQQPLPPPPPLQQQESLRVRPYSKTRDRYNNSDEYEEEGEEEQEEALLLLYVFQLMRSCQFVLGCSSFEAWVCTVLVVLYLTSQVSLHAIDLSTSKPSSIKHINEASRGHLKQQLQRQGTSRQPPLPQSNRPKHISNGSHRPSPSTGAINDKDYNAIDIIRKMFISKLARKEDEEQLRLIEEEEKRERMGKKHKLRHG